MPISTIERRASGCGLFFVFGFAISVVVPLIVGAILYGEVRDRAFLIPLVSIGSIAMLLVPFGAIGLSLFGRKRAALRNYLEAIAGAVGGSVSYPTFTSFAAAPRVDTTFEGRAVEIRLLRATHRTASLVAAAAIETEHSRLGAQAFAPTYRIAIGISSPSPIRVACSTRSRLGAFGASLVGLREVVSGDGGFDARAVVAADDARIDAAFRSNPAIREAALRLLGKNSPYAASFSVGRTEISYVGVVTAGLEATALRDVLAELSAFGRGIAEIAR